MCGCMHTRAGPDVALRTRQVRAESPFQLRVVGAGSRAASVFHVVRVVGVAPGPRLLEDAVVPEMVARVLQTGDVRDAAPRAGGEASLLNSLSPVVVGAGARELFFLLPSQIRARGLREE